MRRQGTMGAAILGLVMILAGGSAFGMHPLITDDAETQGKGKFQLEINGSYGTDSQTVAGVSVKEIEGEQATALTYGAGAHLDLFVEIPYLWIRGKEDGIVAYSESGLSDVSVGAKWRFFHKDGLSFAVKPSVSLPTGDEQKGLGSGKYGYSVFLIAQKEVEPWSLFLNLGHIRNNNDFDEANDLWHVSLAGTYEVVEHLKIAANVGAEKNRDKTADKDPAFALLGIVYEVGETLDLDAGVKKGLNEAETDVTYLAGVTVRF
ncbi:MAG: transporter [Nitrospiraceae bacterium]|nr:transporter [Nitrospiraceae bacterium]